MRRPRTTIALAVTATAAVTAGLSISQATGSQQPSTPATSYVPDEPLPTEPVPPQEQVDALGITGYPDKLSAEPGESVKIMVSTTASEFSSKIVRVTHGDADPAGPGIKEQVIDSPVNKTYPGQDQRLPLGSYVRVRDDSALRPSGSFSITGWIAPTTIPGSPYNRLALQRTPVGTPRPQGLITKWSESDRRGYGLFIDEQGSLALRLGDETVSTGTKLRPWAPAQGGSGMFRETRNPRPQHVNNSGWYFVAASYDARSGKVTVTQKPASTLPDDSAATVTKQVDVNRVRHTRAPLLMAGYWNQPGDARPTGRYNGKIESPTIYDRALSESDIAAAANGKRLSSSVAAWDFSRQMSTQKAIDAGPHRLNGRTVNLPVRALTSHDWDRQTMNYNEDPEQWGAMYFHEDDLGDAEWKPAFTWDIPEDTRSGVYAARLQAGDKVYHATFVVRPKEPKAKIAMLVPTLTYLAYGSTGGSLRQYDDHADGSGFTYSTALRPIQNLRSMATGPNGEGRPWAFEADTHIFDWLETKGYEVDYITDHDVDREGKAILEPYTTVLTGTHPEYISTNESQAVRSWLNDGGRLMYMGGNGFYWITALDGTRTYTELRRHEGTEAWQAAPGEFYHNTDGEFGGLWRFRGTPPQEILGVGFAAQGFGHVTGSAQYNKPFDRSKASDSPAGAWVYDGVSKRTGIGDLPSLQSPGGPMGEEVDRVDYALGTPASALVLGTSQPFGEEYLHVVEENNSSSLAEGGNVNPLVRGDVTLVYYPNGGAVFSAASMVWSGSFFHNNYNNDMTRISENVLNKFTSGEPLPGAK